MNAANEAAVGAFLDGKIGFLDIENTVKAVYDEYEPVTGRIIRSTIFWA